MSNKNLKDAMKKCTSFFNEKHIQWKLKARGCLIVGDWYFWPMNESFMHIPTKKRSFGLDKLAWFYFNYKEQGDD